MLMADATTTDAGGSHAIIVELETSSPSKECPTVKPSLSSAKLPSNKYCVRYEGNNSKQWDGREILLDGDWLDSLYDPLSLVEGKQAPTVGKPQGKIVSVGNKVPATSEQGKQQPKASWYLSDINSLYPLQSCSAHVNHKAGMRRNKPDTLSG